MAVFQFKPCRLSYLISLSGYEDDNGDYHPGDNIWDDKGIECGYVPAGKANEIKYEDGSVKVYSYTLSLPRDCKDFVIGDRVCMTKLDGQQQEFTVLGFQRYQLQCKMWV